MKRLLIAAILFLAVNAFGVDTLYVPLLVMDSVGNGNGVVLASGDSVMVSVISPIADSVYGYKGAYNDATLKTLNMGASTKFPNVYIRVIVASPRIGNYSYTSNYYKAGGTNWTASRGGVFSLESATRAALFAMFDTAQFRANIWGATKTTTTRTVTAATNITSDAGTIINSGTGITVASIATGAKTGYTLAANGLDSDTSFSGLQGKIVAESTKTIAIKTQTDKLAGAIQKTLIDTLRFRLFSDTTSKLQLTAAGNIARSDTVRGVGTVGTLGTWDKTGYDIRNNDTVFTANVVTVGGPDTLLNGYHKIGHIMADGVVLTATERANIGDTVWGLAGTSAHTKLLTGPNNITSDDNKIVNGATGVLAYLATTPVTIAQTQAIIDSLLKNNCNLDSVGGTLTSAQLDTLFWDHLRRLTGDTAYAYDAGLATVADMQAGLPTKTADTVKTNSFVGVFYDTATVLASCEGCNTSSQFKTSLLAPTGTIVGQLISRVSTNGEILGSVIGGYDADSGFVFLANAWNGAPAPGTIIKVWYSRGGLEPMYTADAGYSNRTHLTPDGLLAIDGDSSNNVGGTGTTDWTTDEKKQIRNSLGVTGDTASLADYGWVPLEDLIDSIYAADSLTHSGTSATMGSAIVYSGGTGSGISAADTAHDALLGKFIRDAIGDSAWKYKGMTLAEFWAWQDSNLYDVYNDTLSADSTLLAHLRSGGGVKDSADFATDFWRGISWAPWFVDYTDRMDWDPAYADMGGWLYATHGKASKLTFENYGETESLVVQGGNLPTGGDGGTCDFGDSLRILARKLDTLKVMYIGHNLDGEGVYHTVHDRITDLEAEIAALQASVDSANWILGNNKQDSVSYVGENTQSIVAKLGPYTKASNLQDAISGITTSGCSGSGSEAVRIYVYNGSTYVADAQVTLDNGAGSRYPDIKTNVLGYASFAADTGYWYITVTASGYLQSPAPDTFHLTTTATYDTIGVTAHNFSVCEVSGTIIDINGNYIRGATVSAKLRSDSTYVGYGTVNVSKYEKSVRTNNVGHFTLDLIPNAVLSDTASTYLVTYTIPQGKTQQKLITVPNTGSYSIP
jgi:hypothetical protein